MCVCANSDSVSALGNPVGVLERVLMNHKAQRSICLTVLHNKKSKWSVKKGTEYECVKLALLVLYTHVKRVHSYERRAGTRSGNGFVLRITHQILSAVIKNIFICHIAKGTNSQGGKQEKRNLTYHLLWSNCCRSGIKALYIFFYGSYLLNKCF